MEHGLKEMTIFICTVLGSVITILTFIYRRFDKNDKNMKGMKEELTLRITELTLRMEEDKKELKAEILETRKELKAEIFETRKELNQRMETLDNRMYWASHTRYIEQLTEKVK